ncbi:AraC family transcriptional regulator [Enterococcus sp. LJL128]|uniref:AraC family transcriptional regulator n=1 Tax=Enterococcus sp. LJL51 TaxID=3416656 RepID=UPI003CF463D4
MSLYLEIPEFDSTLLFRTFINYGWEITYPHWHKEIEFIYCLKGTVNLGADEKIITLQEGELYFFPSAQPHFFLASPDSERIVFQYDLKIFQENTSRQTNERSLFQLYEQVANHSNEWPTATRKEIIQLFLQVFEEFNKTEEGWQHGIVGALYQINRLFFSLPIVHAQKTTSKKSLRSKETLEQLNLAFEYIEKNYSRELTLESIAGEIGFSPSYFSRFFKKSVGQSFSSYLTDYRLNQAKYILATESLSMNEVADKAGFTSPKTFHHVFKQRVGCSPLKFRKLLDQRAETVL